MILKFICFLLMLRAGLVTSVDTYYNNDNSTIIYNYHRITSQADRCAKLGVISNCTLEKPYCFVDGDDINCGRAEKTGWRISPLDGLVLNNGQIPNPYCTLFIPPEKPATKEIISSLLKDSVYGSTFKDYESAWFNIFEYLGNCPLKSQFCDEDSKTCQYLFDTGKNCNSSNQCLSRYCEKYSNDTSDNERRCVEENNTKESIEKIEKNVVLSGDQVKLLSIVITISIFSAVLILGITMCLIIQRRKGFLLDKSSSFPNYLSNNPEFSQPSTVMRRISLHSSFLSRISTNRSRSSKYVKRDSSDHFSVLLPPPPTLSRDSSLRINSHRNSNDDNQSLDDTSLTNSRDSFDIYLPPQQSQYGNSFHMSY